MGPLCDTTMMNTYNVNKWTHIIHLVMYLVTMIKINTQIWRFFPYKFMQVAPINPDFWNKWSWGLCVIPIRWITYNVNTLTHITYLVMYLVAIIKKKTQSCRFFLLTGLCKFHQDVPTFKINGHEASVWYQYHELHVMWTNWPI